MPRVLILNPNTTAAVTDKVVTHAAPWLQDCQIVAATAAFGAPYISTEASYAIAGHAALDAFEKHGSGCAATLIACFGDPGIFALREVSATPVIGLAEAAMRAAQVHGRYAIVTGGAAWQPMLQRLAQALGLDHQLVAIRTIALTGAEIAADPEYAQRFLAAECQRAVNENGAQAVILGGAGLAGLASQFAPQVAVPLIDSVVAGAQALATLAALATRSESRTKSTR